MRLTFLLIYVVSNMLGLLTLTAWHQIPAWGSVTYLLLQVSWQSRIQLVVDPFKHKNGLSCRFTWAVKNEVWNIMPRWLCRFIEIDRGDLATMIFWVIALRINFWPHWEKEAYNCELWWGMTPLKIFICTNDQRELTGFLIKSQLQMADTIKWFVLSLAYHGR